MSNLICSIIFNIHQFLDFFINTRSNNPINKNEIKTILLIELTKIGDVILTFPSIRVLRDEFPKANIDFMSEPFIKKLIEHNKDINSSLSIANTKSITGLLKAVLYIRKHKYDLVLSLSPSSRNSILSLLSRTRYKAGYLKGVGSKTPFLHDNNITAFGFCRLKQIIYKKGENIYLRPIKALEAIDIETAPRKNCFISTDDHEKDIDNLFTTQNISTEKNIIVIQPFTPWQYRAWPAEYFSKLIANISKEFDDEILLVGTEKEKEALNDLGMDTTRKPKVITDISLIQLAEIIKRAKVFIGNDSGPLHLAYSVGTPIIGLYGPVSPEITAPLNYTDNIYLYKKVECSPCDQEYCRKPEKYCMSLISVDEVLNAVKKILS